MSKLKMLQNSTSDAGRRQPPELRLEDGGSSGAESSPRTIPTSIIMSLVEKLEAQADSDERYHGADCARPIKEVARDLRARITGATCQWVNTSDAARIKGVSEESIRRWCRDGTADFEFTKENGKYWIWLPDLKAAA